MKNPNVQESSHAITNHTRAEFLGFTPGETLITKVKTATVHLAPNM